MKTQQLTQQPLEQSPQQPPEQSPKSSTDCQNRSATAQAENRRPTIQDLS
jgi:hypothetical protein